MDGIPEKREFCGSLCWKNMRIVKAWIAAARHAVDPKHSGGVCFKDGISPDLTSVGY